MSQVMDMNHHKHMRIGVACLCLPCLATPLMPRALIYDIFVERAYVQTSSRETQIKQ